MREGWCGRTWRTFRVVEREAARRPVSEIPQEWVDSLVAKVVEDHVPTGSR